MKICHGCGGKGWVDSQYKGAVLCPVCDGSGKTNGRGDAKTPRKPQLANKSPLLLQLENWLRQQQDVTFDHPNKTMNTYVFVSNLKGRTMGLVWVSIYGAGRIYLFKGDYGPVDKDNRVKYQNVWGGYPQFEVQKLGDVEYARNLVLYALNNF